HVGVAAQQCLSRTHFGARGQFAFRKPVAAVLLVLCFRVIGLWSSRAECTFIHLAAQSKRAVLRELRRAERARVETVSATDAQIFIVQDNAFSRFVKAVDRTYRH